ncbi:MAG: hypothetical protein ABUT20_52805, partial [Bacteroidota bacterium]
GALPPSSTFVGKYAFTQEINVIWKCNEVSAGVFKWQYYTDAWYDEVVDEEGTIENRPECSTLFMKLHESGGDTFLFPQIKQRGSSDEFELGKNETSLRLLYYIGITGDNNSDTPFATSTSYNWSGASILERSMVWKSTLIPQLWRYRIDLYQRGDWIEKKINYNVLDLLNYEHSDRLRMEFADFLMKQMRVEVGDEISEATMTLLRL